MQDIIISYFSNFPKEWAVFFLSMIPVTELRAAIPLGIVKFQMAPLLALFWAVLGNTLMGTLVVIIVEPIAKLVIEKNRFIHKIWQKYIGRIAMKNKNKFERWGSLALITFIAIPLPMTGAFTGAVAASIFEIPVKKVVPVVLAGCLIAGIIVTMITLGVQEAV